MNNGAYAGHTTKDGYIIIKAFAFVSAVRTDFGLYGLNRFFVYEWKAAVFNFCSI